MDASNVPQVPRLVADADIECPLEDDEASYFLSTIQLRIRRRCPALVGLEGLLSCIARRWGYDSS